AERVHATTVASLKQLAGFVEVRDVGERILVQSTLGNGRGASFGMELAIQALSELELLFVGERLIAEHEERVLVHSASDLLEGCTILDPTKVDWTYLGDKERVKLCEVQRHRFQRRSPLDRESKPRPEPSTKTVRFSVRFVQRLSVNGHSQRQLWSSGAAGPPYCSPGLRRNSR